MLSLLSAAPAARVRRYPASEQLPPSPDYLAEVNGEEVFVYHQPGFAGGAVSWVSFDFSGGPVTVRVTARRRVDSVEVKPDAAGIAADLDGDVATFTLERPGQFFVKWDEDFQLPLYVFANPPETGAPDADDPTVIFFGPGVHRPGMIYPAAGQTVYLAAGSLVFGQIFAHEADDVRVAGRGILCASDVPMQGTAERPHDTIRFRRCRGARVEGITVLDSHAWTVVLRHCQDAVVENVKILNERLYSTDGINPCNSSDVLIRRCFVRSKDDCVAVKGLDDQRDAPESWTPVRNVRVEECVFWSDNNNCLVVGSETRAGCFESIVFHDCDILRTSNTCGDIAGALAVICLDDTVIRDVRFEDIRVEHLGGPLLNCFFTESMFSGSIPGTKRPDGGVMTGLRVRNVRVTGGFRRRSFLRGLDARHRVEDVMVENLEWFGRVVTHAAAARFEVGPFADDVRFLPAAPPPASPRTLNGVDERDTSRGQTVRP